MRFMIIIIKSIYLFDIINKQMEREEEHTGFKFTSQLAKWTKFQKFVAVEAPEEDQPPTAYDSIKVEGNIIKIDSDRQASFETHDYILSCFVQWRQPDSNINMQIFYKKSGDRFEKKLNPIKGKITAIEITHLESTDKNSNGPQKPSLCIVAGTYSGHIKIIDFGQKLKLSSFQIENKPIIQLIIDKSTVFVESKVCFALVDDFSIFIVSLHRREVIGHFRPTIIMCDESLSLSLHSSSKYLLESTTGGYLILWKVNSSLLKKANEPDNQIKKLYNVFPLYILHSASVDGLLWSTFFGDLIAIITKKGYFKIIAINLDEKQEFVVLLEHKIKNQKQIKNAVLFEAEECLLVVKQKSIDLILFTPQLRVIEVLEITFSSKKEGRLTGIESVLVSSDLKIVMARADQKYFVDKIEVISQKLQSHKIKNADYRELHG